MTYKKACLSGKGEIFHAWFQPKEFEKMLNKD
jgi:hypothetical protein